MRFVQSECTHFAQKNKHSELRRKPEAGDIPELNVTEKCIGCEPCVAVCPTGFVMDVSTAMRA